MESIELPNDVIQCLRDVFEGCNRRISTKLSRNPNIPEESLDLTWIEHFSQYSSPLTLDSAWTVKIDTHYLGGLRHFGSWEIADIGVLLFIKKAGIIEHSKVALLQSKRLYPITNRVQEESIIDYHIGFARLADPEDLARSISIQAEFEFTPECTYGALKNKSEQMSAIADFERRNGLSVYYQFYNPWTVPFRQRIPLTSYSPPKGNPKLGVRIVPALDLHKSLQSAPKGHTPRLADLVHVMDKAHSCGWALEEFAVDLFLKCRAGSRFKNISDSKIQNLFYRRTGPISAAIVIRIEAPEEAGSAGG